MWNPDWIKDLTLSFPAGWSLSLSLSLSRSPEIRLLVHQDYNVATKPIRPLSLKKACLLVNQPAPKGAIRH